MAWTVFRRPGKFPDHLESFQMAWKVSIWPGQSPDGLENFQTIWKVSRWPGKFPDGLENIQIVLESLHIAQGSFPKSGLFNPKKKLWFTKTFQVYKNFPGSIATLLPWFFRLWSKVPKVCPDPKTLRDSEAEKPG